jgi:hypothetical protein
VDDEMGLFELFGPSIGYRILKNNVNNLEGNEWPYLLLTRRFPMWRKLLIYLNDRLKMVASRK